MSGEEGQQEPVVVRDRRRIDPKTGQRRTPAPDEQEVTDSMSGTLDDEITDVPVEAEAAEESSDLQRRADELTTDLQRVTAEYANYRKRVERDREAVIASAKASVVADLLTVLDDVERAEAHGDLTGAFKAVADKLGASLKTAGLEPFGAEGDDFDPSVHQAVQHDTSPDVAGPTVTAVLRCGYRFGERVLRPAMVGVTDHEAAGREPEAAESEHEPEQEQES